MTSLRNFWPEHEPSDPGDWFLFVAADLILHYMEPHAYEPPPEFCQAVLASPPILSTAQLQAVAANGGNAVIAT